MKKIFLLVASTLALVACDNTDENPATSSLTVQVSATIGESVSSRAADASWSAGDEIGITTNVGTDAKPSINLKYVTEDGTKVFKGTPIYFYKPMTLTAYYPFTGTEGILPGIIEVNTDSENQTEKNQPKIDFLWDSQTGIKADKPDVNFTFTHRMSKLTFTFLDSEKTEIADSVNVKNIVFYEIEGLRLKGTFDTATGETQTTGDPASMRIITSDVVSGESVPPLIVLPQQPGNNKVKLHIYTDELNNEDYLQHFVCTLTFSDGEIKPGYNYKYTIQVTRTGLNVGEISIVDWTTGQDVKLQATIDGEVAQEKQ